MKLARQTFVKHSSSVHQAHIELPWCAFDKRSTSTCRVSFIV